MFLSTVLKGKTRHYETVQMASDNCACVVVLGMKYPVVSFNVLDHFYVIDEDALVDKRMNLDINDVYLESKEIELANHGEKHANLLAGLFEKLTYEDEK